MNDDVHNDRPADDFKEDSEPLPETEPKSSSTRTAAVRYGQMRHVGEFTVPRNGDFDPGGRVVIQTRRGIEIGEPLRLACQGCPNAVSAEQTASFVEASGPDYLQRNSGRILRNATEQDLADFERIVSESRDMHRTCQNLANNHNLDIKVVSSEQLFGGERVIFYFVAEGRVDFRALVKDLAHEFQTRIEMRQIGARDEARLVADYETCGRECCCRAFLKNLKPVSMKMAKLQKATLDPTKVSGRCGRLKCCLRYEHSSYEDLDRQLPKNGAKVRTVHGEGVVVARQVLTQLLQVQTDAGGRFAAGIEDLLGPDDPIPTAEPPAREPPRPRRSPEPASQAEDGAEATGESTERRPKRRRRRRSKTGGAKPPPTSSSENETPAEGDRPPTAPGSTTENARPEGGKSGKRRRRRRPGRSRREPSSEPKNHAEGDSGREGDNSTTRRPPPDEEPGRPPGPDSPSDN